MKALFLIGTLLMSTIFSSGQATPKLNNESQPYKEIHTNELKRWYDAGKKMVVLDARSKPYFDGILLPHSKWLSYDVSEKALNEMIPDKNSLIVVYCWNPQCPASQYLVDRLVAEGYTNIYKYHEGLQDWKQRGFPIYKG